MRVRRRRIAERERLQGQRPQAAVGEQRRQAVVEHIGDGDALFQRLAAHGHGGERLPALHHAAQVQLGLGAAQHADHHQRALDAQALEQLVPVRAHHVEDHRHAVAGNLFQTLGQGVVFQHAFHQPHLAGGGQVVQVAARADRPRAQRVGQLHARQADAGGGRAHQHPLPRLQATFQEHRPVGGQKRFRNGGAGGEVDLVRQRQGFPLVGHQVFGIGAARNQAHHPVADLAAHHLAAHRLDFTGVFQARHAAVEARRRRIKPLHLQDIRPVHAHGAHFHAHLVRSRLRCGHGRQLDRVVVLDLPRLHSSLPLTDVVL